MAGTKRYRNKSAEPGELLVYFGKLPHDGPDICYAWGGGGASKRDANLITHFFGGKRCEPVFGDERSQQGGLPYKWEPRLIEELEARGYDLTTLKFSIQKKAVPVGEASEPLEQPAAQQADPP